MDVTVAVCTHRQYAGVARTVASLVEQKYSRDSYRVLVIDNAPIFASDCAKALASFQHAEKQVDIVVEKRLGVSHARNRALKESNTEILAFIDADCVADSLWLEHLVTRYHASRTPVGAVGGMILPDWETPPPKWLIGHLESYLSLLDLGPEFIENPRRLVGCNIAYSVPALRQTGGFRSYLGRVGPCLLSNEEVAVFRSFRKRGLNLFYEPAAVVRHRVPVERISRSWFRKRVFWQAVSDALLEVELPTPKRAATVGRDFSPSILAPLSSPVNSYEEFDNQLAAIYQLARRLAHNPEDVEIEDEVVL